MQLIIGESRWFTVSKSAGFLFYKTLQIVYFIKKNDYYNYYEGKTFCKMGVPAKAVGCFALR